MTILKAFASAQFCTLIDFVVTVVLSSVLGVYYVVATALGAVSGGVSNCIVNYRWVFPHTDSKKYFVALKYLMVWLMSILLNTYGTYLLTEGVRDASWVTSLLGSYSDQIYIASKMAISLLVSLAWNYPMQRYFVYRNLHLLG